MPIPRATTDKKLAGTALTSFMKCESDAKALWENAAADRKLLGGAKRRSLATLQREIVIIAKLTQ